MPPSISTPSWRPVFPVGGEQVSRHQLATLPKQAVPKEEYDRLTNELHASYSSAVQPDSVHKLPLPQSLASTELRQDVKDPRRGVLVTIDESGKDTSYCFLRTQTRQEMDAIREKAGHYATVKPEVTEEAANTTRAIYGNTRSALERLPLELRREILSYLPDKSKDLRNAAFVSKPIFEAAAERTKFAHLSERLEKMGRISSTTTQVAITAQGQSVSTVTHNRPHATRAEFDDLLAQLTNPDTTLTAKNRREMLIDLSKSYHFLPTADDVTHAFNRILATIHDNPIPEIQGQMVAAAASNLTNLSTPQQKTAGFRDLFQTTKNMEDPMQKAHGLAGLAPNLAMVAPQMRNGLFTTLFNEASQLATPAAKAHALVGLMNNIRALGPHLQNVGAGFATILNFAREHINDASAKAQVLEAGFKSIRFLAPQHGQEQIKYVVFTRLLGAAQDLNDSTVKRQVIDMATDEMTRLFALSADYWARAFIPQAPDDDETPTLLSLTRGIALPMEKAKTVEKLAHCLGPCLIPQRHDIYTQLRQIAGEIDDQAAKSHVVLALARGLELFWASGNTHHHIQSLVSMAHQIDDQSVRAHIVEALTNHIGIFDNHEDEVATFDSLYALRQGITDPAARDLADTMTWKNKWSPALHPHIDAKLAAEQS